MCVELDLTKPLVLEFSVEGQVLCVVYESLGLLCNNCGWFGHNKEGCDAFHRKNTEGGMDVEEMGEFRKSESVAGGKELWKTVQRTRRQRRNVMPVQHHQTGSRFSVLDVDSGDEERRIGKDSGKERVASEEVPVKGQREGFHNQQRRFGKIGSLGESSKGLEMSRIRNMERSDQEGRKEKEGKMKNVLAVNNDRSARRYSNENLQVYSSYEAIPKTNLDLNKWKEVDMNGKENLHPGEYKGRVGGKERMDTGELQAVKEEEDLIESLGMSMEEGCMTPMLAD